jgi:hypothetical protein
MKKKCFKKHHFSVFPKYKYQLLECLPQWTKRALVTREMLNIKDKSA